MTADDAGGPADDAPTPGTPDILGLVRELCSYTTRIVAKENEALFQRIAEEVPLKLHRYASGETHLGWVVPDRWRVEEATVSRAGEVLFDGTESPIGVATYSNPFHGEVDLKELEDHVVTDPDHPDAHVWHCMWEYRPWAADWALSIPHRTFETFEPGTYRVDLQTRREPGEMLVAEARHEGRTDETIVLGAHTCHPRMANDDMAGVAVLVRLFQRLMERETRYSYRLVLGPEHLGPVFYLRDHADEVERFVGGAFAEMPGVDAPVKVASSFTGEAAVDRAFRNAARHHAAEHVFVPWRRGAGNDETVWEAPGYEVPFVEVSRARSFEHPFEGYHTDLDTPDALDGDRLAAFFRVFEKAVEALERDAVAHRRFAGLPCLSNPDYDLYLERPDPAVEKELDATSETWGRLQDSLLRHFDGEVTLLEVAERHGVPFDQLRDHVAAFEAKGLIRLEPAPPGRPPISRIDPKMERETDRETASGTEVHDG